MQISEEKSGIKWHWHAYAFLSGGWYEPNKTLVLLPNGKDQAIGLGVDFDITHVEPRGQFKGEGTNYSTRIGLIDRLENSFIGGGRSVIKQDTRLRIYASR